LHSRAAPKVRRAQRAIKARQGLREQKANKVLRDPKGRPERRENRVRQGLREQKGSRDHPARKGPKARRASRVLKGQPGLAVKQARPVQQALRACGLFGWKLAALTMPAIFHATRVKHSPR
jgi:hypothetical protein